jgi:putative ABC transport system substrate-binding protein
MARLLAQSPAEQRLAADCLQLLLPAAGEFWRSAAPEKEPSIPWLLRSQGQEKESPIQLSTIRLIATLALVIFTAPLVAEAQQATTVYRIGRLSPGSPLLVAHLWEAFRQGLHELGYVEGQNLILEARYAEGSPERLHDVATELVRLPVDVIVAEGAAAVRAAQHATRTIPIVMAAGVDAVGEGLVASLARPGGNITGLSFLGEELPGKRLEILKETVPQSTRIAVLANPAFPAYASRLYTLTMAARALGLHLHVVEVRRADELDTAFAEVTRAGADAVLVIEDAVVLNSERGRVVADLAATTRLPVMYGWREWVVAGCLMSYGPSRPGVYRQAAIYVDKLLKGVNPAALPVEQATKFELVINRKTAQALGLTTPPSLLCQADEVIQ